MSNIEHKRLKIAREELGFTQAEMGKLLGLNGSTADLERGKTRITGHTVMLLMRDYGLNPLWLYGENDEMYLPEKPINTIPQQITVDTEGNENILMVPAKAAAGYGQNIGDAEFYADLRAFSLPLEEYRQGSFRGFEVQGDSMQPLVESGDWVLARAVDSWDDVREEGVYVLVEKDSVRLKKVRKVDRGLELISLNPEYPTTRLDAADILELWEYKSRLTSSMEASKTGSLEEIYRELQGIKKKL